MHRRITADTAKCVTRESTQGRIMKKNQLSKAITLALTGAVSSLIGISDAAAGTVNYNAFNHDRAAPNTLVGGAYGSYPGGNGTDGCVPMNIGTTPISAAHRMLAILFMPPATPGPMDRRAPI